MYIHKYGFVTSVVRDVHEEGGTEQGQCSLNTFLMEDNSVGAEAARGQYCSLEQHSHWLAVTCNRHHKISLPWNICLWELNNVRQKSATVDCGVKVKKNLKILKGLKFRPLISTALDTCLVTNTSLDVLCLQWRPFVHEFKLVVLTLSLPRVFGHFAHMEAGTVFTCTNKT